MSQKIGFDYSSISQEHQIVIGEHVKAITSQMRQSIRSTIDIGRRLKQVRDLLGAVVFRAWASVEFEWTYATALTYMTIAERFGDLDCLEYFHQSALVLLVPKRVPPIAVNKAIERARNGQMVSKTFAQELIDRAVVEQFSKNPGESSISAREARTRGQRLDLRGTSNAVRSIKHSCKTLRKSIHKTYEVMSEAERKALADELTALADALTHEPVIQGDVESIEADGGVGEYSDKVNADAELATV